MRILLLFFFTVSCSFAQPDVDASLAQAVTMQTSDPSVSARVLVFNGGFEWIVSNVYVQWIHDPTESDDRLKIDSTLPVREIIEGAWNITIDETVFLNNKRCLFITGTRPHLPYGPPTHWVFSADDVGKYRLTEISTYYTELVFGKMRTQPHGNYTLTDTVYLSPISIIEFFPCAEIPCLQVVRTKGSQTDTIGGAAGRLVKWWTDSTYRDVITMQVNQPGCCAETNDFINEYEFSESADTLRHVRSFMLNTMLELSGKISHYDIPLNIGSIGQRVFLGSQSEMNPYAFENSEMDSGAIEGWLHRNKLQPNSTAHLIAASFNSEDNHEYGLVVGYPQPNPTWFLYDRDDVGEKNYYVVGWIQLTEEQQKEVKEFRRRF